MVKKYTLILIICLLIAQFVLAEEEDAKFDWDFNIGMGVETFDAVDENGNPTTVSYSKLALSPDFSFGKFGIGLELTLHYLFQDSELVIRPEDWYIEGGSFMEHLELYMAKFKYIRWDHKGSPLYVKFGAIEDGKLGNGFILNNYSNTLYLPDVRVFGLSFDVDGALFNFPLVGMETFVGNVIDWDVLGARLFVRPLSLLEIPIFNLLEFGVTIAGDIDPFTYVDATTKSDILTALNKTEEEAKVFFVGADFQQPILANPVIALMAFGDLAMGQNNTIGGSVGAGGSLLTFLSYVLQLRFIGQGFIPNYFDSLYDLERPMRYAMLDDPDPTPDYIGWLGVMGTSLFEGLVNLNILLDGPFNPPDPDDITNYQNFLHLVGSFTIGEGLIPGLTFEATYDKKFISEFREIFNFNGAMLYARINYQTGPAVISLFYQMKYENGSWNAEDNITSGLESLIKLN